MPVFYDSVKFLCMIRTTFDMEAKMAVSITEARTRAGLTQQDVLDRMRLLGFDGWHLPTVSRVEAHKRKVTALELIGLAVALETRPADLVGPAFIGRLRAKAAHWQAKPA